MATQVTTMLRTDGPSRHSNDGMMFAWLRAAERSCSGAGAFGVGFGFGGDQ